MKFLATVHLLIDADCEGEACDAVSGLLTECGLYEEGSGLIDWAYMKQGQRYIGPGEVDVPADYDRDEDDLNDLAGHTAAVLKLYEASWLALEELSQWQGLDETDEGTIDAITALRSALGISEHD